MPRLIRLYIVQVIAGFGLSAAFVGALMWFDVANLWSLVSNSDMGAVAVLMLWVFNGIVFAGVQFAISIMRMGDDEAGSGGRRVAVSMDPAPVLADAQAPRSTLKRLIRH